MKSTHLLIGNQLPFTRPFTQSVEKEFQQKSKQSKILLGKQSLNVSDFEMAEQSIIQYIQAKHFAKEIFKETSGKQVQFTSLIR